MAIKIYLYDRLDKYGQGVYYAVEITEEQAEQWVQVDFEKRSGNAKEAGTVQRRSPAEIVGEINDASFNNDRRAWRHAASVPPIEDGEGNTAEFLDTVPDTGVSPETYVKNRELHRAMDELLK